MTDFSHTDNSAQRTPLGLPSSGNPLILVVEDNEDMRFLLRTFLEMRGMRVVEAEDGEAGARVAEELRPDLILMDWSLPRMDGIAATNLIRKRNTSHHIPIVLLSGHAAPTLQKATREAGYCEYLVKPFDLDQLDHVLRKHLLLRVISAPAESPCEFHRGVL